MGRHTHPPAARPRRLRAFRRRLALEDGGCLWVRRCSDCGDVEYASDVRELHERRECSGCGAI